VAISQEDSVQPRAANRHIIEGIQPQPPERPSREKKMLSDTGITLAGHTFTTVQLMLGGVLLLGAAIVLALGRAKRLALQRSVVTDEIAIQLGRIAAAVEQLVSEAAARRMMEERHRAASATLPPVPGEEKHPISYSMFGR